MKLTRVSWPHLQKDLPGEKGALTFVTDRDYDLRWLVELRVIEVFHRESGRRLLIDQSNASMTPEPAKAPDVPVAQQAGGGSRTSKSSKR